MGLEASCTEEDSEDDSFMPDNDDDSFFAEDESVDSMASGVSKLTFNDDGATAVSAKSYLSTQTGFQLIL